MRSTQVLPTLIVVALTVAGCATTPVSGPASAPAAGVAARPVVGAATSPAAAPAPARPASGAPIPGTPPPAPPPAPPVLGAPPAHAVVIKDAKKTEGLFTLWQKEDKVWIELKPDQLGKAYFLSPKIAQGLGEAGIFGGTMIGRWGRYGRSQLVEFQRVHNQVRLMAVNTEYVAAAGSPEARAVAAAFSPSLLSSTVVASQPHPESKAILVEASPLFLGDLLGLGTVLQTTFRQGYGLDPRHTSFTSVRGSADQVVFNVQAHFATGAIASPVPGAPPGAPVPSTPRSTPDARSMFIGLYYAITKLPETPMAKRAADQRVGYFSTPVYDFSSDLGRSARQVMVNRWRLEKKDPAAAVSEPVKPIEFHVDRSVPVKYRESVKAGILAWNAAFERIGFKDAIKVTVQADDSTVETLDVGIASVRWITTRQPQFGGIGPSQVDPRSGEILDADILIDAANTRSLRSLRSRVFNAGEAIDWDARLQSGGAHKAADLAAGHGHGGGAPCTYASHAAEQLGYALDVLAARGEVAPDSAEAERFVQEWVKDVVLHEVGHTLGLRHNFRSSRAYTLAQLADPVFTAANGIAGSVMDYSRINLPPSGVPFARHGSPFGAALGPYDHWAIEFGYKPFAPADEVVELQRIAARSSEPQLAFGTDEDNSLGIDPESLQSDLGDDPIAFAKLRFDIAREMFKRQETRQLDPADDWSMLRRTLRFAVLDATGAAGVLARQIGGVRTLRDHVGSGRDPLQPVPGDLQRRALEALATGVLASDSFKLSAALQRKLAPDYLDRGESFFAGEAAQPTDFTVAGMVLDMQRALLNQLMGDGIATRILDSQGKVDDPAAAFRLSELHSRLSRAIWSELGSRSDISAQRRELQRDHANRLASLLMRPSMGPRADARSLVRVEAATLLKQIQRVIKTPALSAEARAHLAETAEVLGQALSAKVVRPGV